MVASGLLISCMTPAASCPIAASFSLWRIWPCTRCHSVTSSPMVITWVISSPSSRMGILLRRKVRGSPASVTSCSVCWISPVSNTRSNSARSWAAGWRVSTSKTGRPTTSSRRSPWVPVSRFRFQLWMR